MVQNENPGTFTRTCSNSEHLFNRLRMQRAIEHLRDDHNISVTAFWLGYQDPSHFSREFKKHYGFAPNKYRK
jgi:AraC-like DNA-binding protein